MEKADCEMSTVREYDGENFFYDLLIERGFTRVSDEQEVDLGFENADFIHKKKHIILEIKTINTIYLPTGGYIPSLGALIVSPTIKGHTGHGEYLVSPPSDKTLKNSFEEPVRRLMKKANRQIKSTQRCFAYGKESTGILLMVFGEANNIGTEVYALLAQSLRESNGFRSLDGVTICSPYWILNNCLTNTLSAQTSTVLPNDKEKILNVEEFSYAIDAYVCKNLDLHKNNIFCDSN